MKKLLGYVHDMGNKLTVLSACSTNAKKNCSNCENFKNVKKICRSVDDAVEIFNGMREYAVYSNAATVVEPFHIGERESEIEKRLVGLSEKFNIETNLDFSELPSNVKIYSNQDTLCRILMNCVENAVKAKASKFDVKFTELERTVEITYTDNGEGMTEEVLQQIGFGYSTSGGGQGVSIIRSLLNETGGFVTYSSKKGYYTEVKVTLGKVEEKEEEAA